MNPIDDLINNEERRLYASPKPSPNQAIGILYNLITLRNNHGLSSDNYKAIKCLVENYIEVIKSEDYGYDDFNYEKLLKVIKLLSYEKQISLYSYSLSILSRELPEHSKEWFIEKKHTAQIFHIFSSSKYISYPKAILLFFSLNVGRLVIGFIFLFSSVFVLLLPATQTRFEVFNISYDKYSSNYMLNHFLNVLTLFADVDNDFEIKTSSWFGIILVIIGKILFVLLIVNFIYRKVSDKIAVK